MSLLMLGILASARATRADDGKVSGLLFGDYYYIASSSGNGIGVVSPNAKKENGFQLRRIYFQYDRKLDDQFATRFRLEINDAGFGKTDKYIPFVKAAYLKYTHAKSGTSLFVGMYPTPTFDSSESIWGYRSIEKTIIDLQSGLGKMKGTSADIGAGIQGRFDQAGKVNYWLFLANGTGQKPETDNKKKIYGMLQVKPTKVITLEVDGDFEPAAGDKNAATIKGFLGYSDKKARLGIEAFLQNQDQGPSPAVAKKIRGLSLFGAGQVAPKAWVFGRVDCFDPSNHAGDDRSYLFVFGVDANPIKDVHIMPNFYVVKYQKSGVDTDFIPRLTFFYTF